MKKDFFLIPLVFHIMDGLGQAGVFLISTFGDLPSEFIFLILLLKLKDSRLVIKC